MTVKVLFFHCESCMATFKAIGMNPQFHSECKCIYLPLNNQ